ARCNGPAGGATGHKVDSFAGSSRRKRSPRRLASRRHPVGIVNAETPMVYLSRIYTKTGDQGDTGLGDGTRVAKDHPRVAAYGSVDELNAVFGLLIVQLTALPEASTLVPVLQGIQNDLFDLGADLCVPQSPEHADEKRLRV